MSSLARRFAATARRPKWIAVLVLALATAAAFAALGQWQLERSVENSDVVEVDAETVVPLTDVTTPGGGVTEAQLGRTVEVRGTLVAPDAVVLTGRNDGGARQGAWLVGHLVTADGDSLAVALGFAADADAARAAIARQPDGDLVIRGRYLHPEEPQASDFEAGERSALSVADLVNTWAQPGPVFGGYVVASEPLAGLESIEAPAPSRDLRVNWLNIFYAIEWVIFAGFAVYLWYRLVRDEVEREDEAAAEESAEASAEASAATVD